MVKTQVHVRPVSPEQLTREPDFFLLDVRIPAEFSEKQLKGSELHPLAQLQPETIRERAGDRPVCVVCQSGGRAKKAAALLAEAGLENVSVLEGGVGAWEAAGLPLVRGAKTGLSLERQVRIAAGSLVLAGAVGALIVHPAFAAVSAFVGAGLIFAGLTDWCGMGLLLARMPWNKGKTACCAVKR